MAISPKRKRYIKLERSVACAVQTQVATGEYWNVGVGGERQARSIICDDASSY